MICCICRQPIAADGYYVDVHKLPADLAPHPAHWPHCPVQSNIIERDGRYFMQIGQNMVEIGIDQ